MNFNRPTSVILFCLCMLVASQTLARQSNPGASPTPKSGVGESNQSSENDAQRVSHRATELIGVMQHQLDDPQTAQKAGVLEPFFDFSGLTKAPIQPHEKELSSAQKSRLEKIFAQLIRQLAYASGAQFRTGKITQRSEVVRESSGRYLTLMDLHQDDDDVDNEVGFVWHQNGPKYSVIDVQLDGVSVVKDYENQFAKIIARDGAEGLLRKMQSRLDEAQKQVKAKV